MNNLYVCGAACFPASGHANPTLTIVALAIRLADHIRQAVKRQREQPGLVSEYSGVRS